jgi:hypothetical protein
MRPPSSAVFRRFLLLGALIATVALAGCGGGDSAIPGKETGEVTRSTTTVGAGDSAEAKGGATGARGTAGPTGPTGARDAGKRAPAVASGSCQAQLGDLVRSLDRLRVRLATGLSYEEYAAAVKRTRRIYAALPADDLPADCLLAAGTPAENSVNRYIEAANAWGECLADAGCDAGVVEPELQRDWQVASHWLSEAQEGLKSLS